MRTLIIRSLMLHVLACLSSDINILLLEEKWSNIERNILQFVLYDNVAVYGSSQSDYEMYW